MVRRHSPGIDFVTDTILILMEREEASTSFALARILSIHQANAGASEGHAHHSRPYNLCPACMYYPSAAILLDLDCLYPGAYNTELVGNQPWDPGPFYNQQGGIE